MSDYRGLLVHHLRRLNNTSWPPFQKVDPLHRSRRTVAILYYAPPLSRLKIPSSYGDLSPNLTRFIGPIRAHKLSQAKRHLDRFSRFAGLTSVTDRQTDRPRYSVGNNRPHLHYVLRCGLIMHKFLLCWCRPIHLYARGNKYSADETGSASLQPPAIDNTRRRRSPSI